MIFALANVGTPSFCVPWWYCQAGSTCCRQYTYGQHTCAGSRHLGRVPSDTDTHFSTTRAKC
jgi:hypothetical protein